MCDRGPHSLTLAHLPHQKSGIDTGSPAMAGQTYKPPMQHLAAFLSLSASFHQKFTVSINDCVPPWSCVRPLNSLAAKRRGCSRALFQ
jgi:hypothetical protein